MINDMVSNYWDPLHETIHSDSFQLETRKLLTKMEQYKKNPYVIKRNRLFTILIWIFIVGAYIYQWGFMGPFIHVLVLSGIPFLIYTSLIHDFQQNFILFLMSQEHGWAYKPHEDESRIEKGKKIYPDIFDAGHSPQVEDQVWGTVGSSNQTDFWNCSFTYTTGSGKSRTTHHHTIFILRLPAKLPIELTLFRKGLLSFSGSKYKTESEEFNKIFLIRVQNENTDSEMQVMKLLSPSVQVRLIQMAREFPLDGIVCKADTFALDFNNHIWKPRYTNFFNKVEIDRRDTADFTHLVEKMTQIPREMLQFMD